MTENSDILTFLGLMKRAGALSVGADDTAESCKLGKARLALLACDTAENTVKWIEESCRHKDVPVLRLAHDKKDMGDALGVGGCATAAVCDTGFSLALCKKLGLWELTEKMELRLQREKRRKAKKLAGKSSAHTSEKGEIKYDDKI
ncbi:MAG: ribosomal L7Ae/L30e/S12e/Gadd45 family protein [Clostridiaceae bacterium]|nr:ribosomal L7Ae/L30e/S12e/Gadd45 family protein [Clostridiaceae bacterium]